MVSLPRTFVKANIDHKPKPGEYPSEIGIKTTEEKANLVSSKLTYEHMNLHAPALDVDHKVECYESSTPGHYHILIDVPMPWWKYRMLMWWMYKCGILEKGYYKASAKKKASYLRKKGVLKPGAEIPSDNKHKLQIEDLKKQYTLPKNAEIMGVGYIAAEKDETSVIKFMKNFKPENVYNIPINLIDEKDFSQDETDYLAVNEEGPEEEAISFGSSIEKESPWEEKENPIKEPEFEEWQTWQ